ncbi:hypothetical protein ACFQH6_12025 [Halobacteriaceae archaeon GCM10025711]
MVLLSVAALPMAVVPFAASTITSVAGDRRYRSPLTAERRTPIPARVVE